MILSRLYDAEIMESIFIIVAIQLIGLLAIYLILRNKIHKHYNAAAQIENIRKEVEKVLVQINQTTAHNIELIEHRINSLREIMGNTDKRIKLLKREEEKHDISQKVYSDIMKKDNLNVSQPPVDIKESVIKLYENGFNFDVIAQQLGIPLGEVELIISLKQHGN